MDILWSFWNRKRITATIKPLVLAVAFWDMFQAADANFFTSVPGWGRSNDRFKKDADLLMLEVILETWQPLKTWQCMGHSLSPTEQIRMSMFSFKHLVWNGLPNFDPSPNAFGMSWTILLSKMAGTMARSLLGRPCCFGGWPNVDFAQIYLGLNWILAGARGYGP